MSDAGERRFISAIEGLAERTKTGVLRARYCVSLSPGTPLTLSLHDQAIVVLHDNCDIGSLPAAEAWIADHLTVGRRLNCAVLSIKTGGVLRKRAKSVEVEIDVDEEAGLTAAALRAAADFTTGSAEALRAASDFTTSSAQRVGDALIQGGGAGIRMSGRLAAGVGDGLVDYGVRKPTQLVGRGAHLVGQGFYSAADLAGRPVRAFRRLVRNIFLAAVTILVLVLAIVVIWRLPSLPGFSSSPPAIFSPR